MEFIVICILIVLMCSSNKFLDCIVYIPFIVVGLLAFLVLLSFNWFIALIICLGIFSLATQSSNKKYSEQQYYNFFTEQDTQIVSNIIFLNLRYALPDAIKSPKDLVGQSAEFFFFYLKNADEYDNIGNYSYYDGIYCSTFTIQYGYVAKMWLTQTLNNPHNRLN